MKEYVYDYGANGIERKNKFKDLPYITILLILANVITFFVLEIIGNTEDTEFLYTHGAMYWPSVTEHGEWYRVFTHMFVHSGMEHLFDNMLMLGILGYHMEKEYGSIKYFVSYLLCGAGATAASVLYEMQNDSYAVGIGASGAIMGIFGIFLAMQFLSRRTSGMIELPRLLIIFAIMVFGNMQEGVDWMAHFGGALTGVIIGLLLYRPKSKKS